MKERFYYCTVIESYVHYEECVNCFKYYLSYHQKQNNLTIELCRIRNVDVTKDINEEFKYVGENLSIYRIKQLSTPSYPKKITQKEVLEHIKKNGGSTTTELKRDLGGVFTQYSFSVILEVINKLVAKGKIEKETRIEHGLMVRYYVMVSKKVASSKREVKNGKGKKSSTMSSVVNKGGTGVIDIDSTKTDKGSGAL